MSALSKLFCALFGHSLVVKKRFSLTVRQVGCRRCPMLWGMHDEVKAFIPWDRDLEETSREFYPEAFQGEAPEPTKETP